jgi:hypothetical protein
MKAKIKVSGLNLRSTPEIGKNIVTILKKSNELDIIQPDQNGWTKVQYGIHSGFVSSKYIEIIPEPVPVAMTLTDTALQIAISQLGNAEIPHGSNWGKHVEKYLKSVSIELPASWCMAFVYWCVNEAAKEMGVANPLEKTGGVMNQWINSKDLRIVDKPRKGDIFIMDFGKGKGHTGFVASVTGDRIYTIEGNSNDEGVREGFEVCRKPGGRSISSCKGFLRLS